MRTSDARQDEERFLRVLSDASAALEAKGVEYLLIGGGRAPPVDP